MRAHIIQRASSSSRKSSRQETTWGERDTMERELYGVYCTRDDGATASRSEFIWTWCAAWCNVLVSVNTCAHHAGALAVPDVWVEPGQTFQHPSQPRHADTGHATETRIGGHGPQQVFLYLKDRGQQGTITLRPHIHFCWCEHQLLKI